MPNANLDANYGMVFTCPAVVAKDESAQLRIMLASGIGNLSGFVVLAMFPNGETRDITTSFAFTPVVSSLGFVIYSLNFAFTVPGHYSFLIYRTASGLERQWIDSSYCAEWAARIDVPVSQIGRQRADIQRVYSRINQK